MSYLDISSVDAQQVTQWAPDERVPGYNQDTFTPYLVADYNRTVHAFANQSINGKEAIVYRQWSFSKGWTVPIDILLSPLGTPNVQGVFIDNLGVMHMAFWSGDTVTSNIYYSRAYAVDADSADAWTLPLDVGKLGAAVASASIVGDNFGNLIIIYSGRLEGNGVYAISSNDGGNSWSDPSAVFLTNDSNLIPYSLRLMVGNNGIIHATWNVVTSLGTDVSLYYAQYNILENVWTVPILLEQNPGIDEYFGPSFPALASFDSNVMIMYNAGNPFMEQDVPFGRPVQRVVISGDNGESWGGPTNPFPLLLGRSGEHALVVDSAQRVHALFVQRIDTTDANGEYSALVGIWHSIFQEGKWSDPYRLTTTYPPHDIRAVIVQGNVLLMAWREDPAFPPHGVWYSYIALDTPELPLAAISTQTSIVDKNEYIGNLPNVNAVATSLPPKKLVRPLWVDENPAGPLIFGVISSLVVIFFIVVDVVRKKHP